MALFGSITTPNIASPTIAGTLDFPSTSSINDAASLRRIRRPFPFNVNGTPLQWTKLGTVSIHNGSQVSASWGGGCIIRVLGSQGFNATPEQLGYSEIVMWGSNNNTAPNNINGKFSSTGRHGVGIIRGVKAKSVNGTQFDNTYDIWVYSLFYAPNSMVEVTTSDGWIWTWPSDYGTLTQTDPGSASNTVRVFKNKPPAYGAAAYARVRGSDAVILESYNISSVEFKSPSDYKFTFTEPMNDTIYSIFGTASFNPGVTADVTVTVDTDTGQIPTAETFEVRLTGSSTPTFLSILVFSNW